MRFNSLSSGAKFVRADLHIHSYGFDDGSYDVSDETLTPQNIVDTAITNGLKIISITDHNEITNCKHAIEYSIGKDILVIPGIEVSSTQGHILFYFKDFAQLRSFHGRLNISGDKQRCTQGICDLINIAKQQSGFAVLAHIEVSSGFEQTIGRFNKTIEDIFSCDSLLALEITAKESNKLYTDEDDSVERFNIVKMRRTLNSREADSVLPKIMSSDAHTLAALGKNASGDKKLTRFKIDELSFESIRIALMSYESRIRLEDFIPEKIPHFVGMDINGGLLDGQSIKFSHNLTCIIGGRGTGKSTLLESLREVSGNQSESKLVDCEVWPQEIVLHFEDETGKRVIFKREKNNQAINASDSYEEIDHVAIESYGQGKTADTIQHSDQNPRVLLDFLDKFIDIHQLLEEDKEICRLLVENQSALAKDRIEVEGIPATKRQIGVLETKKQRLEKDKVGDLVKYQTSLILERGIRESLIKDLNELVKSYKGVLDNKETFEHFSAMSTTDIIVGKDEFEKVKQIIDQFATIVQEKATELDNELNQKIAELKVQLSEWKSKENEIQQKIDEKRIELEKLGIPFDIGKINQIATDLQYYNNRLRKQIDIEKNLKKLEEDRKELISRRIKLKQEVFKKRYAFAIIINENLKNSVDNLFVTVKYSEGCYSPEFERHITQIMGWRTSQVPKAFHLSRCISPLSFSEGIKKKQLPEISKLKDNDGNLIFTAADIQAIIEKSNADFNFQEFESMPFEDLPAIQVTKLIEKDGKKIPFIKSIGQLSLGQQQSILLAILIQSKSNCPLLIDQPEDNLDSEFIYKSIVKNLRLIKERRQVIIVTHNPNITVLGDAELVVPLKSSSTKTIIADRGSIDTKAVRDLCCDILEGGSRAFLQRQKIYGLE